MYSKQFQRIAGSGPMEGNSRRGQGLY